MKTTVTQSRRAARTWGMFHTNKELAYLTGVVHTPWGIVSVYMQWPGPGGGSTSNDRFTAMRFVANGYEFERTFHERSYTERGLVTHAGRFAREMTEKTP